MYQAESDQFGCDVTLSAPDAKAWKPVVAGRVNYSLSKTPVILDTSLAFLNWRGGESL